MLRHFDENAATEIHTYANTAGLGAILMQKTEGHERVIAYANRSMSKADETYSEMKQDCLAIVCATFELRSRFYGGSFKAVNNEHAVFQGCE